MYCCHGTLKNQLLWFFFFLFLFIFFFFFLHPEIAILILLSAYLVDKTTLDQFEMKFITLCKNRLFVGEGVAYIEREKYVMFCCVSPAGFYFCCCWLNSVWTYTCTLKKYEVWNGSRQDCGDSIKASGWNLGQLNGGMRSELTEQYLVYTEQTLQFDIGMLGRTF